MRVPHEPADMINMEGMLADAGHNAVFPLEYGQEISRIGMFQVKRQFPRQKIGVKLLCNYF